MNGGDRKFVFLLREGIGGVKLIYRFAHSNQLKGLDLSYFQADKEG